MYLTVPSKDLLELTVVNRQPLQKSHETVQIVAILSRYALPSCMPLQLTPLTGVS